MADQLQFHAQAKPDGLVELVVKIGNAAPTIVPLGPVELSLLVATLLAKSKEAAAADEIGTAQEMSSPGVPPIMPEQTAVHLLGLQPQLVLRFGRALLAVRLPNWPEVGKSLADSNPPVGTTQ